MLRSGFSSKGRLVTLAEACTCRLSGSQQGAIHCAACSIKARTLIYNVSRCVSTASPAILRESMIRPRDGLRTLLLADSRIVGHDTARQLEPAVAGWKLASARDEFLRILGESRFDLVVLCRATNSRYGEAQTLVRTIHETQPETTLIITFGSTASVSDYMDAGGASFYLGQPLIDFGDYVAAVFDGKNIPVISMRDGSGYRDASHL